METKEKSKVLQNKTVKVLPIIRQRPFFKPGHDGEFMYTGCRRTYGLPYDSVKRSFFNPFLNEDEQKEFEKLLNQKEGSLNLYDSKSQFWGKFLLTLTKDGIELNLNNPADALFYRILLVNPKFANDDLQKDIPECEYVLVDSDYETKKSSEISDIKDKALDFIFKIKKSKEKMHNVLRLLGKRTDKDADISWLKGELFKIIEETKNVPGVPNIYDFIKIMEDPDFETKIFVLDAIDAEEIINTKDGYKLVADNVFIGKDLQNLYEYFRSNTAEVKEKKLIIQQRLRHDS